MLARVAAEERFIEVAANLGDDHVLGGADGLHRLCAALEEGFRRLVRLKVEPVERVERGPVDRDRKQLAVNAGEDPVLVGPPFREPGQVVRDVFRIGVKDVRSILVDQDTGRVVHVVGIAPDVRPTVDQKHPPVGAGGKAFGDHRTGEAAAYHQIIEGPPTTSWTDGRSGRHPLGHSPPPARLRPVDLAGHLRLCPVPGELGQGEVHCLEPLAVFGKGEGPLAGRHEGFGAVGDGDALELAVVALHIGYRGGDHRLAASEVFGGLGGADEARRFIDGERHQCDVPASQIGRQLFIGLAAEVVDVWGPWQVRRIDLHHRPDHHQAPVGVGGGHGVQQRQVHPLVDDAIEAQPRMRRGRLIGGIGLRRPRAAEVSAVDARRKGMDVGVPVALGLVEAVAASEDNVGRGEQLAFEFDELRRRETEVRQLVHAVVHGATGAEMPGELEHHRGVVPTNQALGPALDQEAIEQTSELLRLIFPSQTFGQHGRGDHHPMFAIHPHFQSGLRAGLQPRLLPIDHQAVAREPAHQVLRALKDEVPAQVGETNDCRLGDFMVEAPPVNIA